MEPDRKQNPLIAVFWDYPEYTDEGNILRILEEKKDGFFRSWAMRRFLVNGRVIDAFKYFSLKEIAENIDRLRLDAYSRAKWSRLLEVYGPVNRA